MPETAARPAQDTADVALLARIVGGDGEAVGTLYDRHARLLFGLIVRIVGSRAEAEDVLQEVFLAVWTKAATYDAALGAPTAWLVRLARNRSIDRLRSGASRARVLDGVTAPPAVESPEAHASRSERQDLVRLALGGLTPDQRRLVEAAYYDGLSHAELAAWLGLPLGTVKTRIRAAMTALRKRLATYE